VHLFGSKRLGMATTPRVPDAPVVLSCGFSNGVKRTFTRGEKLFELGNHLGNVLATVTDKRIAFPQAGNTAIIDHYEADIASAQDYYPFGMLQPGRRFNASGYRYGFNGKENDNDVKGEGNQQDYGMRIYDPRIGKFLSEDPITKKYPELTPYQFASNRPIDGIDEDGLEWAYVDKFNVHLHITKESTDKEKLKIAGVKWVGYDLAWGKPVPKAGTVSKAYTFGASGMTTFGVDAKGEPTKTWQSYASLSTGSASTDRKLGTLHSSLQNQMKSFILKAHYRFGIDLRVSDGFRTVEQQDLLYAQGRTQAQVDAEKVRRGITRTILVDPDNKGGIVTKAIGGYSNHNFGLAIDVVPEENGRLNWNTRKYPMIGLIGESRGLEWGGRWRSMPDAPHFQNLWGYSLGRLRRAPKDSDGLPILSFQQQ
jgi:RHS repeat-associated protein